MQIITLVVLVMPFRNFILFSDIRFIEIALGIVPASERQSTTDSPLLPLVAKGDESAMKKCIDAYGPLVWSIVCRRISERVDAEEACQEIFTEIWRIADRFDSKASKESTLNPETPNPLNSKPGTNPAGLTLSSTLRSWITTRTSHNLTASVWWRPLIDSDARQSHTTSRRESVSIAHIIRTER